MRCCPSEVTKGKQRRQCTSPTTSPAGGLGAFISWCVSSRLDSISHRVFQTLVDTKCGPLYENATLLTFQVFLKYLNATAIIVHNICLYVGCSGLKIHILETVLRISSSYKGQQIQMRTSSWQFSSTVL